MSLNSVYDVDSFGSQLVYIDLYGEHGGIGQTVWLIDLATGERRPLNKVQQGVDTLGPRIDGNDVVWSANHTRNDGAVTWQVVHYDLSSGTTSVVADGVNSRKEDGSPSVPLTAVQGGQIAYTVESATADWPYGWKIVVRSLADGAVVREIQTRYSVWYMVIDNGNVLYSEVPPEENGGGAGGLMLSTVDHPEPVQVADNGSDMSIDGTRIVWSGVDDLVVNAPVVNEAVYTATLDDLNPVRLSQPVQGYGGRFPAAGDGLVTWSEPDTAWDDLFVWDSRTNQTYQIAGQHDTLSHRYGTYLCNIGGGWLTWSVSLTTDTQLLAEFDGIKTEDLRAAELASHLP